MCVRAAPETSPIQTEPVAARRLTPSECSMICCMWTASETSPKLGGNRLPPGSQDQANARRYVALGLLQTYPEIATYIPPGRRPRSSLHSDMKSKVWSGGRLTECLGGQPDQEQPQQTVRQNPPDRLPGKQTGNRTGSPPDRLSGKRSSCSPWKMNYHVMYMIVIEIPKLEMRL